MANNFMLKLLIIFFGCLNFSGVGAQISKKPDIASSAIQQDGYQANTLLTSVINKADIPDTQVQSDDNGNDPAEMDNAEVLSDVEEDDDDDESPVNELFGTNATNFGDVGMSSASKGGERLKVRLVRYHKADCEKKRHPHKGKKLKEGKCYKLHKNHFKSYEFYFGKKKKKEDKKGKDEDDDDESEGDTSKGCRVMIFFDKKCKDEASSTNAADSCKDIGEEGVGDDDDDDDDDDKDKKLHARDLMVKRDKGPKYKSAKFLCDGVDTSENTTKTETEDDYSVTTTVSSQPVYVADPTGSSSKSYTPSSITATRSSKSATHLSKSGSEEPTTTSAPVDEKDPDDDDDDDDDKEDEDTEDEKEDDDREDEEEDDDEDKETSSTASSTTKNKKHKTKSHKSKKHTKTKKHHTKTQSQTVATESAQAASDAPSP